MLDETSEKTSKNENTNRGQDKKERLKKKRGEALGQGVTVNG